MRTLHWVKQGLHLFLSTWGTKKNSPEFRLPDWKLEALVYAIAHSFIIGEKLMSYLTKLGGP